MENPGDAPFGFPKHAALASLSLAAMSLLNGEIIRQKFLLSSRAMASPGDGLKFCACIAAAVRKTKNILDMSGTF
jgi:hypothetical protein